RPPRVFYNAPDGSFRIGIHIQKPHPDGPLGAMRDSHASGPEDLPGYRDASVRETTYRGHPAAVWTFTWSGDAPDFDPAQGPRRTYDLAWEQDGKLYDIWVSSPLGDQATGKRHWETATDTFATD
ncbi:serine/threonine protein kinase, partial [Streptomyces sp. A7024]|nr:serine/threonine protein kinase [Streptomyces coryli]